MGKVICKNCGFENTSDDIFCKDCGKMIMTSEYSETAVAEKQNEEKPVAEEKTETNSGIDPAVLEFLDADTYGQKLNILASLKHRITDDMITTMALVYDLEVEEGPVEVRYEQLRNCLLTKEKYECVRVR